jgi:hypothetical protein
MRITALLLLVVACVPDQPTGPGVKGSRADMKTAVGTYAGYSVTYPCAGTWADVGLRGLGTVQLTSSDQIAQAGNDILTSLKDIPSVWGGAGYGLQCESGIGTGVFLDDWRDVDRVIARVGQLLHDRNLALQVAIKVDGIPVPDSN